MEHASCHPAGELLASIFGTLPPSPTELTARAEEAAAAELACAQSEAAARVQAAALQGRVEQQAAMRQLGLSGLDAATLQGNPAAVRQALTILERESRR